MLIVPVPWAYAHIGTMGICSWYRCHGHMLMVLAHEYGLLQLSQESCKPNWRWRVTKPILVRSTNAGFPPNPTSKTLFRTLKTSEVHSSSMQSFSYLTVLLYYYYPVSWTKVYKCKFCIRCFFRFRMSGFPDIQEIWKSGRSVIPKSQNFQISGNPSFRNSGFVESGYPWNTMYIFSRHLMHVGTHLRNGIIKQ